MTVALLLTAAASADVTRETIGHSAGGGFMLNMAPLESGYLAAVAVHARVSGEINDMAWTFLSPKHLDTDPHFREYKIGRNGSIEAVTP